MSRSFNSRVKFFCEKFVSMFIPMESSPPWSYNKMSQLAPQVDDNSNYLVEFSF